MDQGKYLSRQLALDAIYASDLNPMSCADLGRYDIVGRRSFSTGKLTGEQASVLKNVRRDLDELGLNMMGTGGTPRLFVLCRGQMSRNRLIVPLMPN